MRAIDADDKPASFVLTNEDPADERYFLWRFMVDEGYQRRGVGRRAMELLLERWRGLGAAEATRKETEITSSRATPNASGGVC
jgi:diamine N-acetyltransferase